MLMNTNNNNENDSPMEMIEFLQNNDLTCCQNIFIERYYCVDCMCIQTE